MRMEYKTVVTESKKPVYVAEDGTEFASERDCIFHEIEIAKKKIWERDDIDWCSEAEDWSPFNGAENYEHHGYKWCKPATHDAVEALLEAYPPSYGSLDEDCIGKWCCIEEYDGENFWTCIDDDIAYVKNLCRLLGIEVEFKEETK